MKIAITGKGGVGKTMLAAVLSLLLSRRNERVLAVDADPDANLACALGVSREDELKIIPISQQVALIEERTGAKVKQYGQVFKLNPEVSDIADNFAYDYKGVSLLVLGAVEQGGGGCACPESVLLRALVSELVLYKNESLIMDMEAGVEHLGRATSRGVDRLVVVVEPGQSSIDCAERISRMAAEIGLEKLSFVANKVTSSEDEAFVRDALVGREVIGAIPYLEQLRKSDRSGCSVLDALDAETLSIFEAILEDLRK